MSFHQNPDGSNTDGVKIEAPGTFVGHASVTSMSAATTIGSQTGPLISVAAAVAAGATQAIICAITAAVAYRLDGTAPTATVGMQIPTGTSIILNMTDAANAKFISATGAIFVTFTL